MTCLNRGLETIDGKVVVGCNASVSSSSRKLLLHRLLQSQLSYLHFQSQLPQEHHHHRGFFDRTFWAVGDVHVVGMRAVALEVVANHIPLITLISHHQLSEIKQQTVKRLMSWSTSFDRV